MADIFVSYARADAPLAAKIAESLKTAGYEVWWDSELLPHHAFAQSIEKEVRAARAVVRSPLIGVSCLCRSTNIRRLICEPGRATPPIPVGRRFWRAWLSSPVIRWRPPNQPNPSIARSRSAAAVDGE